MPQKSSRVEGNPRTIGDTTKILFVDEANGPSATSRAKRDRRIREIEERFRALTEYSADPISEVSQDRRLIYVSPSFTKTFGYEPEEVI